MRYILFIFLLGIAGCSYAQGSFIVEEDLQRERNSARICFYNLENFFDWLDNPEKENGSAFTPEGMNHWTKARFWTKANNIAKVFIALGQWELPEIIGVCEIENENVIKHLLYNTPLLAGKYKYVYYESSDARGINVALFYRPDKFRVIDSYPVSLANGSDTSYKTRDILYVQGMLVFGCQDTLHLFVNHWPSRFGGYAISMDRRNHAGKTLRLKVDSLLNANPNVRILIMGDFNDYPNDESITACLRASYDLKNYREGELVNMMYPHFNRNNVGTHKYQQYWGILDQIIVSHALYHVSSGLRVKTTGQIFSPDFLLEDDNVHLGKKPFRTYLWVKYNGGFSDHLPVYIDLLCD
ncbi:MAG: endonuclease [Bacteroidales bacterium]|jgi:predicted extracellular nuclease|nr:endonuclease [Bacteroidales bacterium]